CAVYPARLQRVLRGEASNIGGYQVIGHVPSFLNTGNPAKLLDNLRIRFFQLDTLSVVKRMVKEIVVSYLSGRNVTAASDDNGISWMIHCFSFSPAKTTTRSFLICRETSLKSPCKVIFFSVCR